MNSELNTKLNDSSSSLNFDETAETEEADNKPTINRNEIINQT